jgi:hypothetical protein
MDLRILVGKKIIEGTIINKESFKVLIDKISDFFSNLNNETN